MVYTITIGTSTFSLAKLKIIIINYLEVFNLFVLYNIKCVTTNAHTIIFKKINIIIPLINCEFKIQMIPNNYLPSE